MRKVEHRLRLDLLRGGNQGYIRVKRGENGARRLAVALYMHSVPYMADAGTTAVFRAIKPDDKKLFDSTTITDNVVTVELTTQTVAALGTVRCELSIYGTNNELLYSPQFDVIVEDYLYSDTAVESTGEYTELTEAISKVNNIVSTEAARVAAENQRVANETARGKAETERETAETARAAAETARATAETERASAETTRASAESSRAFSENIRKQAEKQRVSSETQRDTAETARSTAESGRRSAETARVQEFNAIKADAQDAATAEAARATNEAARISAEESRTTAETERRFAEKSRQLEALQWANATAEVKVHHTPNVVLGNKDGHKHFEFWLPAGEVTERNTIAAGDIEKLARKNKYFVAYKIPLGEDINNASVGLPADLEKTFLLINIPYETVSHGNEESEWIQPQVIMDGANIYMRRLMVVETGTGSEDDPIVVSYYAKEWEPVGGTADAVTYTPQTLTTEQQEQARTNIGAEKAGTAYTKPASGIPKSDLADDVQTSLAKADTAISLGLTAATPGQIIKVKAVQDGKPTEWEAVDMPGGDKWEKIKEITIAEDAGEANALTINADENGNTFRLKKARLCAKFPAYTGTSNIPNYSFAMLNGKTTGRVHTLIYTGLWPKISTNLITGAVYYVDVSGTQQIEHAQCNGNVGWSDDTSHDYRTYGSNNDQLKTIYGDTLWAKPITSIGGTGMLIYPGCHFVLYGVRE